jgi:hypothetical protein
MARSEGLEPPTPWFEAKYSIQLSYERIEDGKILACLGVKVTDLSLPKMVGRIGIEPMTQRLKAFCSTD